MKGLNYIVEYLSAGTFIGARLQKLQTQEVCVTARLRKVQKREETTIVFTDDDTEVVQPPYDHPFVVMLVI